MFTETMITVSANKKVAEYLKSKGFEFETTANGKLTFVTSKFDADTGIEDLARALFEITMNDTIIEGYYDCYEYSGYQQKFKVTFENGILKKYRSEWFSTISTFDSYEEFCEEYEDSFSEEEYESFLDEEHFIVDDDVEKVYTDAEIPMIEED